MLLLAPIDAWISNPQFLFIDLVALVPLSIFQAWTGAHEKLTPDIPTATLFYTPVVLSVAGSGAIQFINQLFWYMSVRRQPFYTEPQTIGAETIGGGNKISYEDTVLFQVSCFQYVVTALAFSNSKPFRKPIQSNLPFLFSVIGVIVCNFCFLFLPNYDTDYQNTNGSSWFINFFLLEPYTYNGLSYYTYRYWILLGVVINTVITLVYETFVIKAITKYCDKKQSDRK